MNVIIEMLDLKVVSNNSTTDKPQKIEKFNFCFLFFEFKTIFPLRLDPLVLVILPESSSSSSFKSVSSSSVSTFVCFF